MGSSRNRSKGHDAERHFAKLFREMGWENCQTSRYASRMHDDNKVDLVNIPFNVQIKAGAQRGMNPSKVLSDMKECIESNLPQESHKPNILVHRKDVGKGCKRDEFHDLVIMTWDEFTRLINKLDI